MTCADASSNRPNTVHPASARCNPDLNCASSLPLYPPTRYSVWQRTRRFSLYGRISVGRNGLDGTRRGAFRAGTERIRLGRPDSRRRRRFSGGPARAPPPAALRPAGISGRAPLRRRVCAVPAAAARGRAGPARAGGCWRRGRRGRPPARTGPARAAAPGRGRGAPGR